MIAFDVLIPGGIFVLIGIVFLIARRPLSHYRGFWNTREVGIAFPILLGTWFVALGGLFMVLGAFRR
jgi:hypothetical protein